MPLGGNYPAVEQLHARDGRRQSENQGDIAAAMPLQAAGQVEFQQDHEDLRRMQAGMADDLVHGDRCRAERLDDTCAVVFVRRRGRRKVGRFL